MSTSTQVYFCRNSVRHNGKRYGNNDAIDLTEAEAAPLLASLAITKHNPDGRVNAEAKAKQEADEKAKQEADEKANAEAKANADAEAKAKQGAKK